MTDFINIYIGKLASDADDEAKKAYVESAVRKIAEDSGWTADGEYLYSPGGNERLKFYIDKSSSSTVDTYFAVGAYTRYNAEADWNGRAPNNWWAADKIIDKAAYATIVKSISGKSWALKLSSSPDDPVMELGMFTNADGRVWIRAFEHCNNSYFDFHDGVVGTKESESMISSTYATAFNAEKTMLIPMPDPFRGSYFIDVFRPISITGSSYAYGSIFYANGAYYRAVGNGYMIRIA